MTNDIQIIYDKDMYYSLVQLSTAFILQSAVFSCHFVAYAKSQFVTHLSKRHQRGT